MYFPSRAACLMAPGFHTSSQDLAPDSEPTYLIVYLPISLEVQISLSTTRMKYSCVHRPTTEADQECLATSPSPFGSQPRQPFLGKASASAKPESGALSHSPWTSIMALSMPYSTYLHNWLHEDRENFRFFPHYHIYNTLHSAHSRCFYY